MADLSDIENALVALIAAAVYPDGTGSPSAVGAPVQVFRGWPIPTQLDASLAAGTLTVSVFATDTESRATRHLPRWIDLPLAAPGMALTVSGSTVTVSGNPSSPLNAAVLVDGRQAYIYPVKAGDTLDAVAAGLAALISADTQATSTGAVISIPAATSLIARVGAVGNSVRETKRQKRGFLVTCWCPTPESRDALAALIDTALSDVADLSLPDGTAARLLYERSHASDAAERDGLYRRDLLYSAEYSTTKSQSVAQIVAELLNSTAPDGTPLSGTAT